MRQAVSNDTDIDGNGAIQIGGMTTTTTTTTTTTMTTKTTVRLLKEARMRILKFDRLREGRFPARLFGGSPPKGTTHLSSHFATFWGHHSWYDDPPLLTTELRDGAVSGYHRL